MSADNWAVCPKCAATRGDNLRALDIDLAESYGNVPVEEFDRMRAERDAEVAKEPECTFREDYEVWLDEEGDFHVSYSGGCSVCTFGHKFKHDETLAVSTEPTS